MHNYNYCSAPPASRDSIGHWEQKGFIFVLWSSFKDLQKCLYGDFRYLNLIGTSIRVLAKCY